MKTSKPVLLMIIFCIFLLTAGCNTGTKNPQEENVSVPVSENEKVVMPQEQPSLTGKVKDIVGNEVTVYKVQPDSSEEKPAPEDQDKTTTPADESNMDNRAPEGNRPTGFTVTEETVTFIIPVGTPIVTMQRGSGETNTMELTAIEKDQILRVWMKDDVVEFVQILGGTGGRPGAGEGLAGNSGETGRQGGMGGPTAPPMGGMGGNRQP